MDSKSLGRQLKAYRAKKRWSLSRCSENTGVSIRYLADIERGDKVPKLETFIRILNALEASADDVLQDSLVMGYEIKSSQLLKRLESLDSRERKQVLEIFEGILCSFEKK